jgi:hypothetical protein
MQNSQESLRALAERYGINQKTVTKWKQRETVADLPLLSGCLAGDALPTGSPGRLSGTQRGDDMKFVSAAALALIGCLVGFNSANAEGAAMKTTPTTKILAIGTINPGFEQSQVFAVLPEEVRQTVDLYLDGKIEQWCSLQGKPGVAFIINVTDPAVAHEMLGKLPLQSTYDELRTDPHWPAQPDPLMQRNFVFGNFVFGA